MENKKIAVSGSTHLAESCCKGGVGGAGASSGLPEIRRVEPHLKPILLASRRVCVGVVDVVRPAVGRQAHPFVIPFRFLDVVHLGFTQGEGSLGLMWSIVISRA